MLSVPALVDEDKGELSDDINEVQVDEVPD